MVRNSAYRTSKYAKKLVGDVAKNRADAYGPEQKKKFTGSIQKQVRIEREVKELLHNRDTVVNLPYYIIFGKQVNKILNIHSGETAAEEMKILDQKWATRGLNSDLLDAIKIYYSAGYAYANVFLMDFSYLDGTDVLS